MVRKIGIAVLMAVLVAASSACQPRCMPDPQDDGNPPIVSVTVVYTNNDGVEVLEEANTHTPEPAAMTGFYFNIPENAGYTLLISGSDDGGVASMQIHEVWFDLTPDNNIIHPYGLMEEQDFQDCALPHRNHSITIEPHPDLAKSYTVSFTDFQGNANSVAILVVPGQ